MSACRKANTKIDTPLPIIDSTGTHSERRSGTVLTKAAAIMYAQPTILAILFLGVTLLNVVVLFGVVMRIGLIVQFSVVYQAEKSRAFY